LEPVPSRIGDHDQRPAWLAVQTPIGAAIDETRAKRGVIVLALAVLASLQPSVIFAFPTFWPD
jgi:hypothetical protein